MSEQSLAESATWTCPNCGRVCLSEDELKAHALTVHGDDDGLIEGRPIWNPPVCDTCGHIKQFQMSTPAIGSGILIERWVCLPCENGEQQ